MSIDRWALAAAWRTAAEELGIRVQAPFSARSPDGGLVTYVALVEDFGSGLGTLVGTVQDETEAMRAIANENGYYLSLLSPERYDRYDRIRFVETLNDWGWYGSGAAPLWYTGKPWT